MTGESISRSVYRIPEDQFKVLQPSTLCHAGHSVSTYCGLVFRLSF